MFRYHQYCPVARACEILADRWTLLIVRELLFGSRHFNDLRRGLPRISRSLLVARLRHLEDNGLLLLSRIHGSFPILRLVRVMLQGWLELYHLDCVELDLDLIH